MSRQKPHRAKEKTSHTLTEKEIQEKLYGFRHEKDNLIFVEKWQKPKGESILQQASIREALPEPESLYEKEELPLEKPCLQPALMEKGPKPTAKLIKTISDNRNVVLTLIGIVVFACLLFLIMVTSVRQAGKFISQYRVKNAKTQEVTGSDEAIEGESEKPYTIQVGVYNREADATEVVKRLRQECGLDAYLVERPSSAGRPRFRIYVGEFAKAVEAEKTLVRLKTIKEFEDSFLRRK